MLQAFQTEVVASKENMQGDHFHPDGVESRTEILVERAKAGDRSAFEQIMDMFQGQIFRMVYSRTRSTLDAEDLTQDIFVKAYGGLKGLRDVSRFRAWLFSIAVNRIRDHHKKGKFLSRFLRSKEGEPQESSDQPLKPDSESLDHIQRHEFWRRVRQFTVRLGKWEREIFLLRFLDQLSIREIAETLNKSESTVKTHLYRSIKKFKESESMIKYLEESVHDD